MAPNVIELTSSPQIKPGPKSDETETTENGDLHKVQVPTKLCIQHNPPQGYIPLPWAPDENVAPRSPLSGSWPSDDSRESVPSCSDFSDSESDSSVEPPSEPDERASLLCDSQSDTNSWAFNAKSEADTTSDLEDPWDWETEPLPPLENSEDTDDYNFLLRKGELPIRDEFDGVYRCSLCGWEVEYGRCPSCATWYDGKPLRIADG
jgi:hypothetical protein